jgi:virulence factor Mce-like protein
MRRAGALALLVAAAAAVAVAGCGGGDATYSARFANARGLVAGNDVRVAGAIAGRVRDVRLARDGSADVRFTLDDRRAAPRSDAAAAIRPVDLLGDTYLGLSPGRAASALEGPIPVRRTSNAPRLDELLDTFSPRVRNGLQALLVEGGLALDRRGDDVAATAVALRPALAATDRVLGELGGQRAALARLVPQAERAASQLARRDDDIGPLLDGLARTLDATGDAAAPLERGVAGLPSTLRRVRSTATQLDRAARAATPLASELRDAAPLLTDALARLAPLLDRVRGASSDLRPLLRSTRRLLVRGDTTLTGLASGLRATRAAAPDMARLADALAPAAPKISQGFLVDFPDQAAESGRQLFDLFADPRRSYWRGAAVLSCEAFGVPVAPGCLTRVLSSTRQVAQHADHPPATASKPPPASAQPERPKRLPDLPALPQVPGVPPLPDVTGHTHDAIDNLLDFLLG